MSLKQDSEIIFETDKELEGVDDTSRLKGWIRQVVKEEDHQIERIAYFFISDQELLQMNKEFLDHDELTDILTFPYSYDPIASDIYISYDRVADNAKSHNCTAAEEMRRVIIHGVLHMCGWTDKTDADNRTMRQREDECLLLWSKA